MQLCPLIVRCQAGIGLTFFLDQRAWYSGSWLTVPSLVDSQGTTTKILVIQRFDGRIGIGLVHLDKSETPEPSGIPISDQIDRSHRPVLLKQLFYFAFSGAKRQVSNVDFLHVDLFLLLERFRNVFRHEPSPVRNRYDLIQTPLPWKMHFGNEVTRAHCYLDFFVKGNGAGRVLLPATLIEQRSQNSSRWRLHQFGKECKQIIGSV